jgi:hypothetical protein
MTNAEHEPLRSASGPCRPVRTLLLPRRELLFPDHQSVGTVHLRGPGERGSLARGSRRRWSAGWRDAGEARGLVPVPAANQVKLRVRTEACVDPGVLRRLAPGDVQALSLAGAGGCKPWVTSLSHLEGLEILDLWAASAGDEAMRFVSRLSELRVLDLWGTRVSDAGLATLASLPGLRRLTVPGRHIGDAGMPCLADLGSLRELDLSGSSVTDAGLAFLTRAHSLVRLSLWGTHVTDEGLRHLHRLTSLAEIELGATSVTDAGLVHLLHLPLRHVALGDSLVSPQGLRMLRAALRGCRVEPAEGAEHCQRWRPPELRRGRAWRRDPR